MDDMLQEIARLACELVSTEGVAIVLGIMVAAAMLVGGVLAMMGVTRAQFIGWLLATVIFVAFEEFLRRVLLQEIDNPPTLRPIVLVIVAGAIYSLGLLLGILIVDLTRRPYKKERERMRRTMIESDKLRINQEVMKEITLET